MSTLKPFDLNANNAVRNGPGGRSSIGGVVATVFGANGFIGSYVVNEISKRGNQVVCPYRCNENKVQPLKQMGDLGQVVLLPEFDIHDDEYIRRAISRSNVVINCVGIRQETKNYSYKDVHVDFPTRLAKIVAESGKVERFIQVSEMGADVSHASRRLQTKAVGDEAIMKYIPDATIIRPGNVVGIEDYFYNNLIFQLSYTIVAPVINNGANKVQPTYILDVADAVVKILKDKKTSGKTYYLGGPETLTMRQIYDHLIDTLRLSNDDTVNLRYELAKMLYKPLDTLRTKLPEFPFLGFMMSSDYAEEQVADSVAPAGSLGYKDLSISPAKVTEGLAIEGVRFIRVGGYDWGDMNKVSSNIPEHIRKYYNLK
uniref:39 kDa n=1 Tax=Polytomella sp. Pringsheim 198.80 TaxID=37502 RepID=UPI001E1E2448|nr:Chain P, kDa [Polytomella sp. Pringsheim 198.80]7ARD_P Chain P, kDa [Polytomella sp. Pringsheim 198.80]